MTDETSTPSDPLTTRAVIEPPPQPRQADRLPVLYLLGFAILAAALIWLWQHPATPRTAALEGARIDSLRQQVDTLAGRVAQLESRPVAAPAPAPAMAPLEARIAALEHRVPTTGPIPTTGTNPAPTTPNSAIAPLEARLTALETRVAQPPAADLGPVQQRIDAAAKLGGDATAALTRRVDQLDTRMGAAEATGTKAAAGLGAATDQVHRAMQLQAASAALEAGRSLGPIPGAPPALARFATTAPPTVSALRLSFSAAAEAAHAASQPSGAGRSFLARAWLRAQQAVTVRQGDTILVGDPASGIIEHARTLLDAGDIAGALQTLDTLSPSAKSGMEGWMAQARSLVDARAALAAMAQG